MILFTATLALSLAAQVPQPSRPLPMVEIEACRIEFTNMPMATAGRWGGQIAIYDVLTDNAGALISLKRQVVEGREHLPKLVKLNQLEDCLRKWKFDGAGAFLIRLYGGITSGGFWLIDVRHDSRGFRLRLPVAFPQP